MKILAMDELLPGVTLEKMRPYLKEEAASAWKHYCEGTVRELYFRQDHPGAVMVLECDSVEQANRMTDELPLVKAGLIKFDFIPLGPFLPFAELFKHE